MKVSRDVFGNARNYYLARASEVVAPFLRAASTMRTGPATPRGAWRKGLILGHSHIGDVLYRTPSLPYLRRGMPDCEWHYLTAPAGAEILRGSPDIDRAIPILNGDESWDLNGSGFEMLRRERYDVALCTNTLQHHADLLLAVALGIPNRVAYSHKGLSGLITDPTALKYPSPFPAYFREMVRSITDQPGDWPLIPRVSIAEEDERLAQDCWARLQLDGRRVIACCPTTRQPDGGWPHRFFIDALETACAGTGDVVVLCGAASDEPVLRELATRSRLECRTLAGALPLRSFAAFLRRCSLVFAQDSAPRHLGNAVRVPVAFLRNLAVSRVESGAYCESERDLAPQDVQFAKAPQRDAQYRSVAAESLGSAIARMVGSRL